MYLIKVDDIIVCHLGDFGQEKLTDRQLEVIGDIDILMIPVDGVCTLNAREAVKVIKQIEPNIVIPMHYKLPNLTEKFADVKDFLKEIGLNGEEKVDKLTLKKKDLNNEEMKVVVFKY
ncbi:MBL fold metallo-hydrolase [Patescibacteria group bacterium]|nr:MBL fold metallo-hydrolase [Patescibacteria group bacterium]